MKQARSENYSPCSAQQFPQDCQSAKLENSNKKQRKLKSSSSMITSTSLQSFINNEVNKKTSISISKLSSKSILVNQPKQKVGNSPQLKTANILNKSEMVQEEIPMNHQHLEIQLSDINFQNFSMKQSPKIFYQSPPSKFTETLLKFHSPSVSDVTYNSQVHPNNSISSLHSFSLQKKKPQIQNAENISNTGASEATILTSKKMSQRIEIQPVITSSSFLNNNNPRPQTCNISIKKEINRFKSQSPLPISSPQSTHQIQDSKIQQPQISPVQRNGFFNIQQGILNSYSPIITQDSPKLLSHQQLNKLNSQSSLYFGQQIPQKKFSKMSSRIMIEDFEKTDKHNDDQSILSCQGIISKVEFLSQRTQPVTGVPTSAFSTQRLNSSKSVSMYLKNEASTTTANNENKQMCLAATDYQYQKQIKQIAEGVKKNRFGEEMMMSFSMDIQKLTKLYRNKAEIEPIFAHYSQSEKICQSTLIVIEKCLKLRKSRVLLESLLQSHAKYLESLAQHPLLQLFVTLAIGKIFILLNSPELAIPILKVVKRGSFYNLENTYLMKAYRSLCICHISLSNYEIALGYGAKYLHQTWMCDCASNELNAYDLLGKIFFYLGDIPRSSYYHSRMTGNIREPDSSSLKKMQISYLKGIQKRRYEILASRQFKKQRRKQETNEEANLCYVSSDDENNLNFLIPEHNKTLTSDEESDREGENQDISEINESMDQQINKSKDSNSTVINQSHNEIERNKQVKNLLEKFKLQQKGFCLSSLCKMKIPLRSMPKVEVKADKGFSKASKKKANENIGIEQKKIESMQKFLKTPIGYFLKQKSMTAAGPMRSRIMVSHKDFKTSLQNYLSSLPEPKEKNSSLFEHSKKKLLKEDVYLCSPRAKNDKQLKVNVIPEQNEYWNDQTIKDVDKALRKVIRNITFFQKKRDELKKQHVELANNGKFFAICTIDNGESEQDQLLKKIQDEKSQRQGQYYMSQI